MSRTAIQACVISTLLLLCLYCVDFYEPEITTHRAQSMSRILQSVGMTLLIMAPLPQEFAPTLSEPSLVLLGMTVAGLSLALSRCLFSEIAQHPGFAEPAIVWGSGALAGSLIHELNRRSDIGVRVLGFVDHNFSGYMFAGVKYLGLPDVMWAMGGTGAVRRIIVAMEDRRGVFPVERLMALKAGGLIVEDGAELYEELTGKVWLGTFSISRLLFSKKLRPSPVKLFIKRVFSVVFAVIALAVALPVMLVTALLIWIDSPGPIIFQQIRVGENGRTFTLFKFRSMKVGASGFDPATRHDPRCTRVGRWIRRFRIDELPQLLNILKGDMYFVGPRPFLPEQEASLVHEIPFYRQRWAVRPGATGWAQVHRAYCSSFEDNVEKLAYDLFYIKNLSTALDVLTLLKTFKVVLLGRGGR